MLGGNGRGVAGALALKAEHDERVDAQHDEQQGLYRMDNQGVDDGL